ncbi:hypothetical protein [Paraburkholderia sp. BL10I2N1]|nr:hypothetical protein [Paraburkholderia sp. BL10I2N1]TDN70437.1 hypothetical protein B0G77_3911 [Paraburkholderia sp. BL10I2N1]
MRTRGLFLVLATTLVAPHLSLNTALALGAVWIVLWFLSWI